MDNIGVAADIRDYHIKLKNYLSQNHYSKIYDKDKHVLNWTYGLFGYNYSVATLYISNGYTDVPVLIIELLRFSQGS